MKRFVIFALLGPPLGMITGLWIMLPLFNLALGARPLFEPSTLDWHKVVLLPFAYLMGLLPALAAAGFDELMAKRRWRVLWTALFSFAVAFSSDRRRPGDGLHAAIHAPVRVHRRGAGRNLLVAGWEDFVGFGVSETHPGYLLAVCRIVEPFRPCGNQ